ncbi:MAG TPA: SufD family Fe-S cluster assembly protein [Syntrophomonadaceae bacterium]|nr:SufD family Fe-S cluster assembly protein [Syntrophomonadaceae bacterium]
MNVNQLDMQMLKIISDLNGIPDGAVNVRLNGQAAVRNSTPNIKITPKTDKPGINVEIKPGTRHETVHVPVVLTQAGFTDKVYNTFIVGEDADAVIIAGCGIHNASHSDSQHDGIHEIIVKKGARLLYTEKHYGQGEGSGKRILNPTTVVTVEDGAYAEMELVQIKGVDDTIRTTEAYVHKKGNLRIVEKLLTQGKQNAVSNIKIFIEGEQGTAQVLSRSVAQGHSQQAFHASVTGKTECFGHVECDAIIMDHAVIRSIPELHAENADAVLTHEAAIGKIAGEQLIKLMSLGLTEEEAVNTILDGFLR